MRPRHGTWLWAAILASLLVSCGKNKLSVATDGAADGTPDGAAGLAACLEVPTVLPRPPQDRLPCELIPPGLSL